MEVYLLKSSLALIVLYLMYRIILIRETNNQVKRFVGLACALFATCFFLLPKVELVPVEVAPSLVQEAVQNSTVIQENITATLHQDSLSLFMVLYLTGLGVFAIRFLLGIFSLARLYFKSEKMLGWGFTVVATDKRISPFTFFNLLFIPQKELQRENIHALIQHEQIHRDQRHTVDLLILQFLTILHWFNPIMWLFQKHIRAQHEFLADEEVLKKGFDKLNYQQMLFEEQTGVVFQPVNYLSINTSLKQRIKMMEKSKFNTKNSYFRAALFLPLMALVVFISSFSPTLLDELEEIGKPQFKVYTAQGEVDLEKGITKETTQLFVRAIPTSPNLISYRVAETELVHVSGGLGQGSIKSGDRIDLSVLTQKPSSGDILLLTIEGYQTRDENKVVESVQLEKKVFISIPVK